MPLKCRECGECHTSKRGCDPMRKWEVISHSGNDALGRLIEAAQHLKDEYPQTSDTVEGLFEILMNHFPLDRKGITRVNPAPVILLLDEAPTVQ